MSEATMLLEIPVRVYATLQERARTKHTDPISILEDFLDVSQPPPKKSLAEILLEAPTLTDEELAEYDRIREWMSEWKPSEF